jgi:hypothetical protein
MTQKFANHFHVTVKRLQGTAVYMVQAATIFEFCLDGPSVWSVLMTLTYLAKTQIYRKKHRNSIT